jgi:hypothetical protein
MGENAYHNSVGGHRRERDPPGSRRLTSQEHQSLNELLDVVPPPV